jgi:hypothetical protein
MPARYWLSIVIAWSALALTAFLTGRAVEKGALAEKMRAASHASAAFRPTPPQMFLLLPRSNWLSPIS